MRYGILGPLEVAGSDGPVAIGGRKRRALLTYLLVHHERPVELDRIVDDLWDGQAVAGAAATVQTYISALRRTLTGDGVERQPGGYRLALADPEALDAVRFERLARQTASVDRPSVRLELAEAALGLWRDAPLQEFAGAEWADVAATKYATLHADLTVRFADALVHAGREAEAMPSLAASIAANPLDERFWALMVLALYRTGRQADALQALQRARRVLADELGVDPGPELRHLERRILEHDETLLERTESPAPVVATTLPASGVLTFLMTDIVSSTELWDREASSMGRAVERHEEIVEDTVLAAGGHVVKARGEGDSTLSVFERASEAVAAACALRQAIVGEPWALEHPIEVRMALHSGEAELREHDYYGGALNRAARLRGLAGPNEVVCSRATADLVAEQLPDGWELVEGGVHELRGLRRPEVLYTLRRVDEEPAAAQRATTRVPRYTVLGSPGCAAAPGLSAQLRLLLARLLVDRGTPVSDADLGRALWGEAPPPSARNALQSKISRIRRVLGAHRLERTSDGYRLVVDPDDCDADQFQALWTAALAAGTSSEALRLVDTALACWDGAAYGEFAHEPFARAEASTLERARASAEDRRLELLLDLGRSEQALWEADRVLLREPLRETAWNVRLRALAACGRRVEALRALQAYREQLATETGLHPAGRFLELERTLVEDSAEPDRTATAPGAPARSTRPRAGAAVARGGVAWNGPLRNDTNLVGREAELRFVAEALSDASHGEPRALVIGGEAGIGKTRLLDAIARRGVDTGFDVVRGSAVGSRTGPLGALRDLVARFTPEISDDMGDSSDTTYTEVASAERRWSGHALTLADAIVQRARTHPTLLLADDVQSYDDVSVLALELMHGAVANALPNASERLLVVFAFRSIGVPEPVLARIGRMARAPRTAELRLRGLPESDVVQLVLNATGYPPTRALVDSAAESGNPLVTMSVLQSFAQAGALVVRDGYLDLQGSGQVAVPPDMRQVVSATLAPLEPRVRDAFIRLALLGDGVDLATAQSVLGWSEAEFRALLDEGERAGLLRIDINHVAFEHDVLRWAVTQSVPGATRRRMYAENAARLSADVDPDEVGGVLLLAEQLQLSGVRSSAARVGYWSELAGDHCLTRALWRDAIRYYDAAADAPDTDATQSAGLQLKSGLASFHHHDPWRARDRLLPLLEDDRPASAEDLGSAALALHRAAFTLTSDQELVRRARDALMEFAERDDIDASLAGVRALALAQLAEETFGTQNTAEGRRLSDAARRVATSVDDAAVHARVGFSTGLVDLTDLRLTPALHAFELSARDAGTAHDPWFQAAALGRIGFATAMTGAVEHARTAVGRARELQHALRLWSELALTECTSGAIALVAGDADAARANAQQALRFCDQSGYQFAPALAYPTLVAAAARTGDHAGARQAIATWRTATPGGQTIFEMAALALAGEHQEVEERLRARPLRVPPFDRINLLTLPQLAASTTIALALRLHPQLAELLDRVDQLVDRGVYVTLGWPVFFPSVAAEIGAALDLEDRVRRAELARDAARELGAG